MFLSFMFPSVKSPTRWCSLSCSIRLCRHTHFGPFMHVTYIDIVCGNLFAAFCGKRTYSMCRGLICVRGQKGERCEGIVWCWAEDRTLNFSLDNWLIVLSSSFTDFGDFLFLIFIIYLLAIKFICIWKLVLLNFYNYNC